MPRPFLWAVEKKQGCGGAGERAWKAGFMFGLAFEGFLFRSLRSLSRNDGRRKWAVVNGQ
ncbi:MAG: hypothetical protein OEY93_02110 [Anaerolineae bacterium]|nr:hypothetical protein [Anaerolineae bacterium]